MRRSIIAVIGSFVVLTAPAVAEPGWMPTSRQVTRVAYDRAEVNSEAGTAQLYERINEAASTMCADLNRSAEDRAWCEADAVSRAVAHSGLPSLSAHHQTQQQAGEQTLTLSQR